MWLIAYWVSMLVIIASAIALTFNAVIRGGFVRTFWSGGVAMFGMAGLGQTPTTWLVGFTVSLAGVCIWIATRWIAHDRRYREQIAARRATL